MPFKLNQDCRHHIPKQKHKVTNSAAYDAALRQRGSLTVWFTDEAVAAWQAEPRTTRGGQRWSVQTAERARSIERPLGLCVGKRERYSSANRNLTWPRIRGSLW